MEAHRMTTLGKYRLAVSLWFLLSILLYGSASFLTLSFDVTDWPWYMRLIYLLGEVGILPMVAAGITDSICKEIEKEDLKKAIGSNDAFQQVFAAGVEEMRAAVITLRPDCETSAGLEKVRKLKVNSDLDRLLTSK